MTTSAEMLPVRAAELYYEENKTQDEIGSLLGLTRWKVGRLLSQARELGIVRIEIIHPRARKLSLERALCERFSLADAVVVPSPTDGLSVADRVAEAAADYLRALRPVPGILGVSWGRTVDAVAEYLPQGWARGKTRLAIEADRTVAGVLERAAGASAYLYSAGVADTSSVLVDSGYLSREGIAKLVARGAVGDVVGRYIDADGNIVDNELDGRTVGVSLEQLRSATVAIAVISGELKHAIARAVVASSLCSVFITDEATARAVLDYPDSGTTIQERS